jgi:cysteine desulfurase / selenocysteine lyase
MSTVAGRLDETRLTKADFPLLNAPSTSAPLVFLDNASTTQKPQVVLDAVETYYRSANANPDRGVYQLSSWAKTLYDGARSTVCRFIGAQDDREIVFTSGCTESINLVAFSYGLANLKEGDRIVLPISEHHSNLLPWQTVAARTGAELSFLYLDRAGRIAPAEIEQKIDARTKIVALAHVSNVLGAVSPVEQIVEAAHAVGAVVLLDCAQSIAHQPIDVATLDVDFAAFSGHKVYGPMGIGVLYGKQRLLEQMEPVYRGGGMVGLVGEHSSDFAELPRKFEAGTRNVGGAVGLAQAFGYLSSIGFEQIMSYERALTEQALAGLERTGGVRIYGDPSDARSSRGIVSFNVGGLHSEDIAQALARRGVCIRSGNHCAQPLMRYLGVTSTCRLSVSYANTPQDIEQFVCQLPKAIDDVGRYVSSAVM